MQLLYPFLFLSFVSTIAKVQGFAPLATFAAQQEKQAATKTARYSSTTSDSNNERYYSSSSSKRASSGVTVLAERVLDKVTPGTNKESSTTDKNSKAVTSSSSSNSNNRSSNPYVNFAQRYPFLNNVLIATLKTGAADLLAQTVIGGASLTKLDVPRSVLFMLFGALYSGGFQYLYQVKIFKRLFNVDKFTSKSWSAKLRDRAGLQSLAGQTALDMGVLTVAYLPAFYVFKASVFSGSVNPTVWMQTGLGHYQANFWKDWIDMIRVWLPADLICFSVPMYLRLPVRHIVSFAWTVYLSFARGGH